MSAEDFSHLVKAIVNPISDFIGCLFVCDDVSADKVVSCVCTTVRFRHYVVQVPSAINPFATLPNEIVAVSISITAHKVSVEVIGEFRIAIGVCPNRECIGVVYFHLVSPPSKPRI